MMLSIQYRHPLCCLLLLLVIAIVACGPSTESSQQTSATPQIEGEAARGEQLIMNYGCGACHTIPGVVGANTTVGPPLSDLADRRVIAGVLVNTPQNLVTWIQNPQAVQPDTTMPNMGVTHQDAQDIVAYLYTLN